jgi:hypothetical protein
MKALIHGHGALLAAAALLALAGSGCSTVRKVAIDSKPQGCDIFVDDQNIGKTPLTHDFDFPNKTVRYRVTAKMDGYVEDYVELSRIYLDARNRGNTLMIEVKEDETWTGTVPSPLANTWVQVEVNPRLDQAQAWQRLVDTLTKYYPSLPTQEPQGGYIASEDKKQQFRRGIEVTDVKNQFFSTIASKKPLIFKFKIQSQVRDKGKWLDLPRIFKQDGPLLDDLKARLAAD